MKYSAPVNKLLTYGDCLDFKDWPNYLKLGLTEKHIPQLIQMATDKDLHKAFSDELEVWAPVHAWRALGQLKAQPAIEPLIGLFDELIDDDWIDDELPTVFALIGPAALPFLANYLSDQTNGKSPLILAASCISEIGLKNITARKKSISILTKQLAAFDVNDSELNGFLIWFLIDLQATSSIETIREAFRRDCVDMSIPGDLSCVEFELGLTDKPPQLRLFAEESPAEEKQYPFNADST